MYINVNTWKGSYDYQSTSGSLLLLGALDWYQRRRCATCHWSLASPKSNACEEEMLYFLLRQMLVVIVIVETSAFDDEMGGWKTYFILFHSFCKRPHPWTFDFWTFNSMRPPPKSELDPNGNTLLYDQRIKEIFCSAPFRRVVFSNLMVRRGPSLSWICTQLPPKSELDPDSPVIPSASKGDIFPIP